ncbi:MAG: thioredoxin [Chlorobi bacterium]|nr:thioredoxin [Chlorobiota bacterium]
MTTNAKTLPKSFDELINSSELPVLVDFWAAWCGPCQALAPTIEQLAREYRGKLLVVKINVDEKQAVAGKYEIRSIPTIMIFHRGKPVMRESGALPYGTLKRAVDQAIAG